MTNYIYHQVPEDMYGVTLYPLNALENVQPALYEQQKKKYADGREALTQYWIDALECKWGDVIFLTSIHPHVLRDAFAECGFGLQGKYYQVPVSDLDKKDLILLNPQMRLLESSDFEQFDQTKLEKSVSPRMMQYLREQKRASESPFLHAYSQHVLYRGCIDVSRAEIVSM